MKHFAHKLAFAAAVAGIAGLFIATLPLRFVPGLPRVAQAACRR